MHLVRLIHFLSVFAFLNVKFINEDGKELKNQDLKSHFIIIVTMNGFKIFLSASSHEYHSKIEMFQSPCNYKLTGIFGKSAGIYNSCTNELKFVYHEKLYNIKIKNKIAELIEAIPHYRIKDFELLNKELPIENIESDLPYKIEVFIFNDSRRAKQLGNSINDNTNEIFEDVKMIFKESKLLIEPKLAGIININENINFIDDIDGPLLAFKNNVEPIRFSPFNLDTPLSNSDLVLLISQFEEKFVTKEMNKIIHGMSFFGGSTRLDSSYSTVFTSKSDSVYFIAKKIAHEIGHSLGASHDIEGSIMEMSTCEECNERKRYFSESSRNQIDTFIRDNSDFFTSKRNIKYEDDQVLKNKEEANEYARERRKHTFGEIVKNRLNGKAPLAIDSETSLVLTLLLYTGVMVIVLIYWK
jgi:hypothetical protein